ncbi:tetratricopeptide (TPR) repeat protein [Caulobacter ginsengisoli]|uniref:Tetratricopeptide (TPR) repeat protein n=1 Tax=Caulobacter ginsengisoli TaxID=400775 RepID=A0ABU0IM51_9CAUL|nr:tetratricopeptide repeat protein [Caulobacter ginsengisoli]MDQ0462466.1 tetratricopeptide (TPR) repeat protein [Caulobacter ginsengisoli]
MTTRQVLAEAILARDAGRPAEALDLYARAGELARQDGDAVLLAFALRHVSDLAREQGDAGRALDTAREAVSLYRALPDAPPLDLANALRLAALALAGDEARDLWREAGELYVLAGAPAGARECRARLAAR